MGSAAETAVIAGQIDVTLTLVVVTALCVAAFFGIWAVARNSASLKDVAELSTRLASLELSSEDVSGRLRTVEQTMSHLPTADHVHAIDVRLERVTTVVETTAKQIDRITDHLLDHNKERDHA